MLNILGTKNLTQQAYALVKLLQDKKDPGVLYWLVAGEHEAGVLKDLIAMFGNDDGHRGIVIDPSRDDLTLGLDALLNKQSGIYLLTAETYEELPTMLSLLSDDRIELSVGQKMTPMQLKKKLVDLGYKESPEEMFGFSARGGSINIRQDIRNIRVLFGDDEIEEITGGDSIIPLEIDMEVFPESDVKISKGIFVYSDLLANLSKIEGERIIFRTFKREDDGAVLYKFGDVPKYRRDFKKLGQDLDKYKDYQIVISAVDVDVVKQAVWAQNSVPIRIVEQSAPAEGFIDEASKFLFLSHADVFGRKQIKERKRRDDAAFITKLKINDYIVHEDHGIGRYLGLVQTEIEGHKRENLLIEYSHKDKLYVPVELAYKVDKYIGQAKPKLQRLSGTSWIRMSRKASYDSQKFARNLLKLYAKRSLVRIKPWTIFPDADKKLHESFGYLETPDQEQAIKDVYRDLTKTEPMDRLVVGDVGFGKTEVAIRAAYQAVLNHKQVALLCPTTLLAQQHYDTFRERLEPLGAKVEMLSRFTGRVQTPRGGASSPKIKEVVENLKSGGIDIIIGTHRLLSKDIDFKDIGLVIVDEEQRFGVKHKEKLKRLRSNSHILTLSATPIPRTLYFALSGLRDISTIQTPPEGRQPIETRISRYDEDLIRKAIKYELKRGGQAFYLYNRVQTIQTAKKRLQGLLGSKVSIAIVHGQMPPAEMARVAHAFGAGEIDLLVCSTIIENGLDMPNVNTLIVHNATRFGIGQLYQIRGRIGRGKVKAYAYLLYPAEGLSGVAARRLQILEEAKELGSGFQLAMRDLEMRGMGDMLGKKQHGNIQKVGLSMYGKLLRQAVEEIETGEIQHVKPTVNINLPFDYGIPESLVPDPESRVRLYRQISQASSLEEVGDALQAFQEKISEIDKADQDHLNNLIHILELRFLAEKSPINSIDYQEVEGLDGTKKKQIEFIFDKIKPKYIDILYSVIPDFKIAGDKVVVDASEINDVIMYNKRIITALSLN